MMKVHYHPAAHYLGQYDAYHDIIIIHEKLREFKEIHDNVLRHELEHREIWTGCHS